MGKTKQSIRFILNEKYEKWIENQSVSSIELLFALISAFFLLLIIPAWVYEWPLLFVLPVLLLFAYLFLFRLDKIFEFVFFASPFSIQLSEFFPQIPVDLFLPTEPLIMGLLLVFFFKLLSGQNFPAAFLRHPISIVLYIYLLWLAFTTITSSLTLVSAKYLVMKIWYIGVFYFYFFAYLQKYQRFERVVWLYLLAFSVIIIYTLSRLSAYGFSNFKAAHFVMEPFYRDHTIYGAVLALFIPVILSFLFNKQAKRAVKAVSLFFLTLFVVALIFSYTRAAWISLMAAFVLFLIIYFRIQWKWVFAAGFLILLIGAQFWWNIYFKLESNKQDSSSDFGEHVESIANIATDASNLERINRWKAAWRLALERPIVGWGPGTYQFQYATVQFSYDKTIISTNFGDGGNAHSEYLGHLSETGWPGMFLFIALVIIFLVQSTKALSDVSASHYSLLLGVVLGISTYLGHAFLNNFLDTDKMAVPFWSFLSFVVYSQIFQQKNFALK